MPLQEALAEIDRLRPGAKLSYQALAKKHSCCRTTLARRHKHQVVPHTVKINNQRLLNPRDEVEVVEYIRGLTKRNMKPTRQMVMNFVAPLCCRAPSEAWVTRFLNRNSDLLINAYTTPMDSNRIHADSIDSYQLYFELLHSKMKEYNILPRDTYNMDEKGFAIGVSGRSKRIFDKALYQTKRFQKSLHDGNREWVSILVSVCADGSVLPPGVIYPAAGRAVQANWVAPIDPKKHDIFFTTSPTGWTNDDLGITWLEQVFERYTAPKARRRWRLLILDGHGSHVTKAFIDYCDAHKILLMIYPPHSTHTLQPLDVVCFAPLAKNYTKELDRHTQMNQGTLGINLSDFFDLFWPAWVTTFTKTLVETSFSATGIHPPNADVVLDKMKPPTPIEPATPPEQTAITAAPTAPNWLKAKALLRRTVGDKGSTQLGPLEQAIHQLHVQFELVQHELNSAKEELQRQKKKPKQQKVLPLYTRKIERQGGAVWWSPSSKAEADARDRANQAYQEQLEMEKATKRELQATKKLLKAKEDEEKRARRAMEKEERARLKAVKDAEIAERKAERERQKQARDASKSTQLPKQAKRKLPPAAGPRKKQNRGGVGGGSKPIAHERPPTPPPKLGRYNREITLPKKFW
ncbi:hypothetical protein OPT61_g6878 [Boeremia exigua]|uniref:Uncharacterized protein n=1 Tax=Boeremia exigua TaxID=749465 RepID=A0ACC2I5P4_9PLEO|nr:hypothetical protein OPT61_g6878 [Boeremia exigua]